MNFLPSSSLLFAQIEKWQQMGRDFRTDRPKFDPTIIVACSIILLAIIAAIWFLARLTRQEGRRVFNNPRQLFRLLCRAHELGRAESRLLTQIATAEGLAQPGSVFVQAETFDSAARRPQFAEQLTQLRQLRERLFPGLESIQAPANNNNNVAATADIAASPA